MILTLILILPSGINDSDTNGRQEYTHMGKLDPRANGILRKRRREGKRPENAAVGWYANFTAPGV